jgi:predicted DNA-binding transcriptional regulator AlpA
MNAEIAIDVREASRRLGISRATLYRRAARGDVRISKIGHRSVVLVSDLAAWVSGLPRKSPSSKFGR